jgi:hypothetical protein
MSVFHDSKLPVRLLSALSWAFLVSFPAIVAAQARGGEGPPFSSTLEGWTVTAKKPEYVGKDLIHQTRE